MKIAVVTGASSGMGREFVKAIDREYGEILDEIWVLARRRERLEELAEQIKNPLRIFAIDLLKDEEYSTYLEALKEHNPKVGILVNSSGFGMIGEFKEINRDINLSMVDLNCRVLTKVTYDTLGYMHKGAKIVNLASSAAFVPQPKFAVYAASKSFVLSLSNALRCELKNSGIGVTAVCPGPVKTEFFDIAEENSQVALYKKLVMADPVKVVDKAMMDMKMGCSKSVYGFLMQAFEVLTKLIPHDIILSIMMKIK